MWPKACVGMQCREARQERIARELAQVFIHDGEPAAQAHGLLLRFGACLPDLPAPISIARPGSKPWI